MMDSEQKKFPFPPMTPSQFNSIISKLKVASVNLDIASNIIELFNLQEYASRIRELEAKLDEIIEELRKQYENALKDNEYRELVQILEQQEARLLFEPPDWLYPGRRYSTRRRPALWGERVRVMLDLRKA